MESYVAFLKRLKADVEGLLQNMVEGRYRIFEVLSPGQTFLPSCIFSRQGENNEEIVRDTHASRCSHRLSTCCRCARNHGECRRFTVRHRRHKELHTDRGSAVSL